MAAYTLVITGQADGHQHTAIADFRDDADAIESAKGVLTEEHTSVAVAEGVGDGIEFLGAWDWDEGSARWTSDE